jgi:hypothetical protein
MPASATGRLAEGIANREPLEIRATASQFSARHAPDRTDDCNGTSASAVRGLDARAAASATRRSLRLLPGAIARPRFRCRVPASSGLASLSPFVRSVQPKAGESPDRHVGEWRVPDSRNAGHARYPRNAQRRARSGPGWKTRSSPEVRIFGRRPSGSIAGHVGGPAFPRKEEPVLARFELSPTVPLDDLQHHVGIVARAVLLCRHCDSEPIGPVAAVTDPS